MAGKLEKIDNYRWRIPTTYKSGMRVPGIIYANEKFIADIEKDQSLEQVANAAFLPGIIKASLAMPDIHFGYGLPIGGVVATDLKEGVITPGGVGYDINCGVRLLRTNLKRNELQTRIEGLVNSLFSNIPAGVGSKGSIKLSKADETLLVTRGARWSVEQGYGEREDLEFIEAGGCLEWANPEKVSAKAYERGRNQQATLGSGNHFLEIQYVDVIYDHEAANAMGIEKDSITVMIHSGSRGFGHQICDDYLSLMGKAVIKYGIKLPDRQLVCAPYSSPEANDYLGAMACAANYAWANRQGLAYWTMETFMKVLKMSPRDLGMRTVYDVAHNIVKIEEHVIDGEKKKIAVHRKGATRAFPPGHHELPEKYKSTGQPVLIPGDMGRASFLLVGTQKAMDETFGSTCHGSGRHMSRSQAIKSSKGRAIEKELADKGILVRAVGRDTLREEISEAYKDVNEVVGIVHEAGISKKVARLRPLANVKG